MRKISWGRILVLSGLGLALGSQPLFGTGLVDDGSGPAIQQATSPWGIRLVVVILGLATWYGTQHLIGGKAPMPADEADKAGSLLARHDALLQLLAPANRYLNAHPSWANGLLVASSALIDLLGIFLLIRSIFGPSIGPFVGLIILFGLRQICQAVTALPPPPGMIWRYPGFPSLLVTYGVANDLFFSGHTALAVYGVVHLAQLGTGWLIAALMIGILEILAVLALRAHYTMDVFTGLIAALLAAGLANLVGPGCDLALAHLVY
jgi:hypothetical protein